MVEQRKLLSDDYQFLFWIFRTVTSSILSLYIYLLFCILFYLFIYFLHTERTFWVWGQKCCKYNWDVEVLRGFILSRALSSSGQLNTQTTPAHTHTQIYTHTAIPAHPHIHLNLHMEGFIRRTCDPWMGYVFSLFLWRVDVFLNISLSHSYHSVIFLMNYMNFYKKETELQSYNRVNWCRRIYLTMIISSKIKCSSSVKRLL